ncbi:MAG: DNA primase [Alphaproteobacteria bacterium]|nr:DNA primase [Alphaproteobacteria bacterium]
MLIPDHFIDEVLDRVNISEVIGRDVALKRRGHEFMGLCPFHHEKSPSFTVNDNKQFYHCFGCGAHGTAATYLTKRYHFSFPEAVIELAKSVGMTVPDFKPTEAEVQQQSRRKQLLECVEKACQFFEAQLQTTSGFAAREYIEKRGLTPHYIKDYRIGYAPEGNLLYKQLSAEGISNDLLNESGLIIEIEGKPPYDRFRNRLIFPISDSKGNVIAFGGRILGKGEPKYLNSPDTPLFHKGQTLYAEHLARMPHKDIKPLILAEGYMDVIALNRSNTCHAVAPLGTAVTEDHIKRLWKIDHDPIICMDGDAAGIRSMWRAAERILAILKPGVSVRFVKLPDKMDPDDILRVYGSAKLEKILGQTISLSEFIFEYQCQLVDTSRPEHQAQLRKTLSLLGQKIQDSDIRKFYQQYFYLALNELTKRNSSHKSSKYQTAHGHNKPAFTPPKSLTSSTKSLSSMVTGIDPILMTESQIIRLLLTYPSLLCDDHVLEETSRMTFSGKELDKIRQVILHKREELLAVPHVDCQVFLTEEGLLSEWQLIKRHSDVFFQGIEHLPKSAQQAAWLYLCDLHCLEDIKKESRHAYLEHTPEGEERANALSQEIAEMERTIATKRTNLEMLLHSDADL